MNEQVDEGQLLEALEGVLAGVPAVRSWHSRERVERDGREFDAILDIRFKDGTSQRWVIEIKQLPLEPYAAGFVALGLPEQIAKGTGDYAVVLAPFVSRRSAEILERGGVGFCDLSGNCRLVSGPLFIERTGFPNAFARKAGLRSLFTPGAERVLRALLDPEHRRQVWTVREVAAAAYPGVSVGHAHKVGKLLEEQSFLHRSEDGLVLKEPDKLLGEWAKAYRFQRSIATRYYSSVEADVLRERFAELASSPGKRGPRGLLASFSAAEVLAPHVRQHRFFAYWSGETRRLEKALALKPVSSGENVVILRPYDEGVFYPAGVVSDPVTSPVQTYLDLRVSAARGEEAADAVFDRYLRKAYES